MDGRRFGRASKTAAFSRGGRLKIAGLMSEAALWLLDYARCTRNRPLGRAFPVRIVNGFHPPKVAKWIRWMRGDGSGNGLCIYAASLRMDDTLRALILCAVGRDVCAHKKAPDAVRAGGALCASAADRVRGMYFVSLRRDGQGLNALGCAGSPD